LLLLNACFQDRNGEHDDNNDHASAASSEEWMCVKDPNMPDQTYYFNKITREVTWVMPAHLRYKTGSSVLQGVEPERLAELKQVLTHAAAAVG
jgi:hypothetical protein